MDLQSRAQTGHWKFAVVAAIEAAKWRCSVADCAWWRRTPSSADDADCVSARQRCLSRAVATSSVGGMSKQTKTVTFAKISSKTVNPRDLAGNTEEEVKQGGRTVHEYCGAYRVMTPSLTIEVEAVTHNTVASLPA